MIVATSTLEYFLLVEIFEVNVTYMEIIMAWKFSA